MYLCITFLNLECVLCLGVYVCICVDVCIYICWLGHLDVLGELATHKRSLTHHPSSQGWASRCPVIDCLFVYLFGLYSRFVSVFRMGVEGIFLLFLI